jgi:hypothetical protein
VQLWRVCTVFFFRLRFLLCMFCQIGCWQTPGRPQGSPPPHSTALALTMTTIPARIGCNCGAFAPYFFLFASWPGKAPQAGVKEIWCNCGAFAPYFFDAARLFICYTRQRVLWLLIAGKQSPGHD